jgi:hypothetical protein
MCRSYVVFCKENPPKKKRRVVESEDEEESTERAVSDLAKRTLKPVQIKSSTKGKSKLPVVEDDEMEDALSAAEGPATSEPDDFPEEDADDGEEEAEEDEIVNRK